MEIITTEEVMDKLDIFRLYFDEWMSLAGGIWKELQQVKYCSLPPQISRINVKPVDFGLH